jgi:hypothetical protein
MTPTLPRRQAIPVGKLREVLAHVPDDHSLVPSQVYNFFMVDGNGHNQGYVSDSGEVQWWAVSGK